MKKPKETLEERAQRIYDSLPEDKPAHLRPQNPYYKNRKKKSFEGIKEVISHTWQSHRALTPNRLTYKQAQFAQKIVETKGNLFESASHAYNVTTPESASAVALENLKKPAVINRIQELLQKSGLNLEDLTNKHIKLLDAKRPLVVDKSIVYEDDNAVQADMLKTGYKLHGLLINKEVGPENQVNIQINSADVEKMGMLTDKIMQMNDKLMGRSELGEIKT